MHGIGAALGAAYDGVCALLTVFGLYRLVLLSLWVRGRRRRHALPPPQAPGRWPCVTVQLPIYNERYVVRRLLRSIAALDYPRDRLQVQILDDSTDGTAELTRRLAAVLRRRGFDVLHLARHHRRGFKAGALAAGLARARGDLVAVFDADFVPAPDFLRRMVPPLLQPGVGVVQARWGHLNRESSWFTRLQAALLDGHFAIEQPARSWSGALLGFNGTCGVWRRRAIDAAGGWRSDTLTEDLDLSLRAQLAGWRVVYLDDVVVPGELPAHPDSFRAQQRRWTQGGVQVARKLLPRILAAPRLSPAVKLEAALHLTSYACYPLLVLLAVLHVLVRALGGTGAWNGVLPVETPLLFIGTLPLLGFYVAGLRAAAAPGGGLRHAGLSVLAMGLGAGLAVANTRAVLAGLVAHDLHFERTPKWGGTTVRRLRGGYRAPGLQAALLELGFLTGLLAGKSLSSGWDTPTAYPLVSVFAFGLLAMAMPSLAVRCPGWRRAAAGLGVRWPEPVRSPA
jgi:hypothetical protein